MAFIEGHIHFFFAVAVVLIGLLMRGTGRHFVSDGARLYLINWYDKIAKNGISEQVDNYNIPYQIIIYLMTKLPISTLTAYKAVSCIFDFGIALLVCLYVWTVSKRKNIKNAILAFTFVFCSPIVIMNSAVWAQCDAIYAFFALAALFSMFKEKYVLSFVLWGISFAFKLQAIYLLPFYLIYYLCRKPEFQEAKVFWGIAIWSLYTCNFFLTNMHERYAYILEIVAILYCFVTPMGIPLAVLLNLASVFTYANYLFGYQAIPLNIVAFGGIFLYAAFSFWLFRSVLPGGGKRKQGHWIWKTKYDNT